MKMHLSYSGQYAGILLCGSDRTDCKEHGDRIAHISTTPERVIVRWEESGELCGACQATYRTEG